MEPSHASLDPSLTFPLELDRRRRPARWSGTPVKPLPDAMNPYDDAPKLLAALREMKDGLDLVRGKAEALTRKDNDGIYHPPKFMPASMDDEDKRHKQASRKDKAIARMATENPWLKEIIDDAADRPEEWKETAGDESKEYVKYM